MLSTLLITQLGHPKIWLFFQKYQPTSGLPERVFLGQNSPSVGMAYLVVPLKLEVTLVNVALSASCSKIL